MATFLIWYAVGVASSFIAAYADALNNGEPIVVRRGDIVISMVMGLLGFFIAVLAIYEVIRLCWNWTFSAKHLAAFEKWADVPLFGAKDQ